MLTTRLITVAILLPLFISALLWLPNGYWAAILLLVLLIGSWEWTKLTGYPRFGRWLFSGVVMLSGGALLFATRASGYSTGSYFFPDGITYGVAVLFWLLLVPAWLRGKWHVTNALALALTGWVVLVPVWLALVRLQIQSGQLLIFLGIVWIADSAAYLVGRSFGRRKLAPGISPGKTWEGVIGAGIAVAVYYAVLRFALEPVPGWMSWPTGLIVCGVITIMSIEGDLFESWIKRLAGVKDSGNLLPGHGGVLDRIDGLTASMPLAALVFFFIG